MGFKTFTSAVLTSSDVNNYLMKQAVIQCTSSARPSSPVHGMTIFETDTDLLRAWDGSQWVTMFHGGAWLDFSTQDTVGTGAATVKYGHYIQQGKMVRGWHRWEGFVISSGNVLQFHVPVPYLPLQALGDQPIGTGILINASTGAQSWVYMRAIDMNGINCDFIALTDISAGTAAQVGSTTGTFILSFTYEYEAE